jgi:hypothetical protein
MSTTGYSHVAGARCFLMMNKKGLPPLTTIGQQARQPLENLFKR